MYTLKDKDVKIKIPRKCWGCATTIAPGRTMRYNVSVFQKEFSTSYWCEICYAYLRQSGEDFSDGVAKYEFQGEFQYYLFKQSYLCQERKVIIEKNLSIQNNLNKKSYEKYHEFYTR